MWKIERSGRHSKQTCLLMSRLMKTKMCESVIRHFFFFLDDSKGHMSKLNLSFVSWKLPRILAMIDLGLVRTDLCADGD